ncbi:MAG: hypothetical protein WAM69_02475 [Candidatus Sulfotelmatobacter sp.]
MLATAYAQLGVANTFTGNQTVNGNLQVSSNGIGVAGSATATSGFSAGVGGSAASPGGYGVEGVNTGSGGIGVYGYDSGGTGVSGYGTTGVYGNTASTTGYGVEGVNTSSSGTGVYGTAPHFGLYGTATGSGSTVGVYGTGVDGLQGSGSTFGVYAAGTGASATGAYGTTASTTGYGIEGVNTSASGTGVYGTASHFGVWGVGGSNGVYGVGTEWGVYGTATDTSGTAVGVYGNGVDGLQGSGTKYGVYSYTSAGTAGVYGIYQGASLLGATLPIKVCTLGCPDEFFINILPQAAVWADTSYTPPLSSDPSPGILALLATADDNMAAAFLNNSDNFPTFLAYNEGAAGTSPDIAMQAGGPAGTCTISGGGDTACTGTLKSVVATTSSAGAQRVETYAVQSAENWFEDAGTAQLVNGAARVNLESVFGQTVNTGVEYHVFLTPDGDCKGLYVSAKTASGFEVRELSGGSSSVTFEYRIMAKRLGYEKVRLANVTERFNKQRAQSAKMRSARSSAAPRSIPQMSTPSVQSLAEQHPAPKMLVPPVMPAALPRPGRVTPRPLLMPPVRAALQPVAAERK